MDGCAQCASARSKTCRARGQSIQSRFVYDATIDACRYKIPPHWHGKVEHVTVISGKFNLGMGEKFDDSKGNAMPAGTFGFLPPQMRHFAWASEATVIQLHGEGPWEINYVNPSDDPRKKGE